MKAWGLGGVAAIVISGMAMADVPEVAADIAPIQSLVAQVMQGIGAPTLLVPQGVSPHGYSMRPSEARALQAADVVFSVGPMLMPGLGATIDSLAPGAVSVELVEVAGMTLLEFREAAIFEDHDAHEDEKTVSNNAESGHDGGGHDHEGGMDPHVWLDPENGRAMLSVIAETLAEVDPENADTYRANAEAGRAELAGMIAAVSAELRPLQGQSFVVFHDAYHYFENRFGLRGAGAILTSDAGSPSAARLREIEHAMEERGVGCVFTEPQFNAKIVQAVAGEVKIAELDPIGIGQEVGPGLYRAMLDEMAETFVGCLSE